MRIKNIIFSAWILLTPFSITAQITESALDTLAGKFREYREQALQEKLFAHVDRNFYLTGETLWFKIYSVDGGFHKTLDLSKVAYAEVLDNANFPVLEGKIALRHGHGSGSFFLPASLTSGNYRFRIYTSWMKNFGPEFYFEQIVTIVNPFVAPEATKKQTPATCTIEFFPEGGNLIAGIQSKVAFKISGNAQPRDFCRGFVLNERNDTVATLSPQKFGIGHFMITPSEGMDYRAILPDQRATGGSHALPEVYGSGFVMQLRDSGDVVHVSVRSKAVEQQDVFLFVHARQIISHAERQVLSNHAANFILPKNELLEGISHLTLFTADLQPVCERLYFTYPHKELQINISSNQKVYSPRKKVVVSLQTNAEQDTPVPANLSVSVYKVDSLSNLEQMNIYPYLWLDADLSGTIESPGYYFSSGDPTIAAAMDNLMLTHGWRRFEWKHVFEDHATFKFLPEVKGHIVTGTISKDGQKQPSVFTYLGSPGKIIRAYGSWSNSKGEVRFEIKDFYGPRRIIVQTRTDSSDHYDIKIEDPFSPFFGKEKLPPWTLSDRTEKELLARSIAMQVQDIFYYESFGDRTIVPEVDSSAFYGVADATYYLDAYTRFPVMEEVMREYVPPVFVRKRKDGFHFLVVDGVNGGILSGDPMVLLDGVPVLDVDEIMKLNPLLVEKLEVVKRQYYLGQSVFPGIVSYSTYHGDMGGMQPDLRSISLNYDGLQLKRQFFSPAYTRQSERDRMPDQRYLLHWNADIGTDETGKHQEEFFTSDVPGTYVVVVQGLDEDGHAGSKTYTFKVTSPENP
jgi:hypothetical protein